MKKLKGITPSIIPCTKALLFLFPLAPGLFKILYKKTITSPVVGYDGEWILEDKRLPALLKIRSVSGQAILNDRNPGLK